MSQNRYDTFDSRVAGIPCQIRVLEITGYVPATRYQPSERECITAFDVLDRRGRPALWLERKLTDADIDRINDEYFSDYWEA